MNIVERLSRLMETVDTWLWHSIFGDEDYMGLHPPAALRLRILSRLPVHFVASETCAQPIFIVGCPRSGTTLLYRILERAPNLRSLGQESHWIWEYLHPPEQSPDHSQRLTASDLRPRSERFIRACYGAAFDTDRFVDKCPTNTLRIEALRAVFPKAIIVGITRNGPDNVSSLIDTWTDPDRFQGFSVPKELNIEGYSGDKWVHVLPPGWQLYTDAPIEEVCAHQWNVLNQALLDAESRLPTDDFVRIRYESLLQRPVETIASLFDRLQLDLTDDVESHVRSLDQHVVNTKTKPQIGKWRDRNPKRVACILPTIRPVMEKLRYNVPNPV